MKLSKEITLKFRTHPTKMLSSKRTTNIGESLSKYNLVFNFRIRSMAEINIKFFYSTQLMIYPNQFLLTLSLNFITIFNLFYLSNTQDLGNNLLINGNFASPSAPLNATLIVFGNPAIIPGWVCTSQCQLDNCEGSIFTKTINHDVYPNCVGQTTDINPQGQYQNVTQTVNLDYGEHILQFNYYLPWRAANSKILLVYFNNQLIFRIQPLIYASFDVFTF